LAGAARLAADLPADLRLATVLTGHGLKTTAKLEKLT
jgi:hypothetical protein